MPNKTVKCCLLIFDISSSDERFIRVVMEYLRMEYYRNRSFVLCEKVLFVAANSILSNPFSDVDYAIDELREKKQYLDWSYSSEHLTRAQYYAVPVTETWLMSQVNTLTEDEKKFLLRPET